MRSTSLLLSSAFLMGLTACGGGSGGGGSSTVAPTSTPEYKAFTDTSAGKSTLGGAAVQLADENGATLKLLTYSGEKDGETIELNSQLGTFTDSDGADQVGTLALAERGQYVDPTTGDIIDYDSRSEGYNYVTYAEAEYYAGNNGNNVESSVDAFGYIGVVTRPEDMPVNNAQATYSGTSALLVRDTNSASGIYERFDGTTSVTARFTERQVDVTLENFQNGTTGTASPIDRLSVTNASILGNSFGGGKLQTFKAGANVNITGANTANSMRGNFYGYDSSISAPDEAAGVLLSAGDSKELGAAFRVD